MTNAPFSARAENIQAWHTYDPASPNRIDLICFSPAFFPAPYPVQSLAGPLQFQASCQASWLYRIQIPPSHGQNSALYLPSLSSHHPFPLFVAPSPQARSCRSRRLSSPSPLRGRSLPPPTRMRTLQDGRACGFFELGVACIMTLRGDSPTTGVIFEMPGTIEPSPALSVSTLSSVFIFLSSLVKLTMSAACFPPSLILSKCTDAPVISTASMSLFFHLLLRRWCSAFSLASLSPLSALRV